MYEYEHTQEKKIGKEKVPVINLAILAKFFVWVLINFVD